MRLCLGRPRGRGDVACVLVVCTPSWLVIWLCAYDDVARYHLPRWRHGQGREASPTRCPTLDGHKRSSQYKWFGWHAIVYYSFGIRFFSEIGTISFSVGISLKGVCLLHLSSENIFPVLTRQALGPPRTRQALGGGIKLPPPLLSRLPMS